MGFRIRHMLAMIRSVVRRSAQDAEDVATYAARLDGRIAVIARVHANLANGSEQDVTIHSLVSAELQSHAIAEDGPIRVTGGDFRLHSRAAGALGIALHELVENSAEAGALSDPDCSVVITASVEDGIFVFDWTETLPQNAGAPTFESFGKEYLEDGISYDLEAATSLSIGPTTTRFSLTCPIARVLAPVAPVLPIRV